MLEKIKKLVGGRKQKDIPSTPPSPPPKRIRCGGDGITSKKNDGPRTFSPLTKNLCREKSDKVPGRDPSRWRKDTASNIIFKPFSNCQGALCYEYDHIHPYVQGGASVLENGQILQTKVNRRTSNKVDVDKSVLG
nr:hypothetical protein [Tanacetum cinerariifolium]